MNRYVLCLLVIRLFSCQQKEVDESQSFVSDTLIKDSIQTVSIIELMEEQFTTPVSTIGKVVPGKSVPLSFNSSGKIDKIYISNGSYVKKGAMIASLVNDIQKLNVKDAEITLRKSNRDFEDLLAEFPDSMRRAYWPRIRENLALKAGIAQSQI
jgi:multidrug efflux pump subunit AcrA (membrane-fusion protein)